MMRLYVGSFEGWVGEKVAIDGMDYHHIINVTRHRVSDTIHVFNPRAGEWAACIHSLATKQSFVCELVKQVRPPLTQQRSVHLAAARLKADTWGWMLEKATELGATHIHPLITERVQHTHGWQAHKWQALMKGAAQQCERLDVPVLAEPQHLNMFLEDLPPHITWYAALERCDAPALKAIQGDVGVIIGPEGGFSDHEKHLIATQSHIHCISLGSNILRAETAAMAALALLTVN